MSLALMYLRSERSCIEVSRVQRLFSERLVAIEKAIEEPTATPVAAWTA